MSIYIYFSISGCRPCVLVTSLCWRHAQMKEFLVAVKLRQKVQKTRRNDTGQRLDRQTSNANTLHLSRESSEEEVT